MEYITASLTIDDTYYYLQTAWNAKSLGFVTFDGLHSTNGVQLLWFVIVFMLAMLVKTKTALLFSALVVSFLLNSLCYLVILRIGVALKQPALILILASLWSMQSIPFRIYSMGMENSLHALVFWCVIWQCIEFLIRVENRVNPNFLGLTVILILNAWTRIDSALHSAILFAFCAGILAYPYRHNGRLFFQSYGKALASSIGLASLGFLAQLIAFRIMGDSFLPVSALIKTSTTIAGAENQGIHNLVEVFLLGMPPVLQGRFADSFLVFLGISGILLVILLGVIKQNQTVEFRTLLNLWSCFLVAEILYLVYVAFSGADYRPYFVWYRSPSFIFWGISGSLLALFALPYAWLAKRSSHLLNQATIVFSLAIFAVAIYLFARGINFTSKLYTARYDAALWIADNSPPDTIFAAWNAGQLSFFSNRTFINLDGLINSIDYYERVLQGPVPLSDYLVENKVEYIVDYAIYRPIPDYPVVQTFPLNDETGRSIYMWQVSSQLSLVP
ncbi:MAG TPA: hypothetical protein VFQ23_01980 [Anaerolineales bacterium]|nr:hypothetical protein [Anaerolineales bacterium]